MLPESEGTSPKEIDGVSALVEVLDGRSAGGRELWFRGHRVAAWDLAPSVFREARHRNNEKALLDRFRQSAASSAMPFTLDEWGWIVFSQHHSLYTSY